MNELVNAYYEYITMFEGSPHEVPSPGLRDVIYRFIEKKVNFATVKFKLDNLEDEIYPVPAYNALNAMRWMVLNLNLDDLEPKLRTLMDAPADLNDAKGKLLDFEEYLRVKSKKTKPNGNWAELAACFWHIQAPEEWPAVNHSCITYLQKTGQMEKGDSIQECIECIMAMRRLSEEIGISSPILATLMYAILNDIIEPSKEDMSRELLDYAKVCDSAGDLDLALQIYEVLIHISPSVDIYIRKSEIYEAKGLMMAAIGEAESAVEAKPESLKCHKRLIGLYKQKKMVKEFNAEVKRFEPIWEKKKAKSKSKA